MPYSGRPPKRLKFNFNKDKSQITGCEHVDVMDNSENLTQQKEHETAVK